MRLTVIALKNILIVIGSIFIGSGIATAEYLWLKKVEPDFMTSMPQVYRCYFILVPVALIVFYFSNKYIKLKQSSRFTFYFVLLSIGKLFISFLIFIAHGVSFYLNI